MVSQCAGEKLRSVNELEHALKSLLAVPQAVGAGDPCRSRAIPLRRPTIPKNGGRELGSHPGCFQKGVEVGAKD